jgi:hypothetical protein
MLGQLESGEDIAATTFRRAHPGSVRSDAKLRLLPEEGPIEVKKEGGE